MDDLVQHVQTEVALDGQPGCNWERFWFFVEEYQTQQRKTLAAKSSSATAASMRKQSDEKFRKFLWNNLVDEESVVLYLITNDEAEKASKESDITKAHSIAESNLTPISLEDVSYEKVMTDYKDRIRIAATLDQQQVAALGFSGIATGMSDMSFHVLQTICASREIGVTQAFLSKYYSVDPRSMFHFLKILLTNNLVVKIPVTTDGLYTLLCLHTKFADQNPGYQAMTAKKGGLSGRPLVTGDGGCRFEGLLKQDSKRVSYYSGLIKQKVTDILAQAKSKVMTIEDLITALDLSDMNAVQSRWFNRQLELLDKLKYIQRVHVPGFHRCVQLLKPYGVSVTVDEKEKAKLNMKAVIDDDTPQSGICVHTSLEQQIYKHICDSKDKGILSKQLRKNMDNLNLRMMARILEGFCKPTADIPQPICKRVLEFEGRERRYRYFSESGFEKSMAEDDKEYIESTISSNLVVPTRSTGKKPVPLLAPAARDTEAVHDAEGAAQHVDLTSSPPTPGPSTPDANTASSSTAALPVVTKASKSSKSRPPPKRATGARAQSGKFHVMPEEGVANPERYISMALMQRRKVLMSLIEREKMLEIQGPLVPQYQAEKRRLFPDLDEKSVIDRRTLYRTLNLLESEKKLRIVKVDNIPMVGGGMQSKTFCLDYSLDPDSDEVKRFVKDCTNRNFLFGSLSYKPIKKASEIDIEVETLDEMQRRLGGSVSMSTDIPFASVGAVQKIEYRPPRSERGMALPGDFDGAQYCYEFGWIRAKMMRALILHRFLLTKQSTRDERLYPLKDHPNMLTVAPLFETLTLRIFMVIIGVVVDATPEARAYMLDPKNANVPLGAMPEFMYYIRRPTRAFKKRLREAIEVLDALGLVTPMEEEVSGTAGTSKVPRLRPCTLHLVLNTHYEIHLVSRAPLHPISPHLLDFDLENRKEYQLVIPSQCKQFWLDLQASSAALSTSKVPAQKVNMDLPWSEIRNNFLLNLCNKRLWTDPIRISAEQKNMLMEHVDKKRQFAPIGNDAKLGRIAEQTGLTKQNVVQFYKSLQGAWTAQGNAKRAAGKVERLSQIKPRAEKDVAKKATGPAPVATGTAETNNNAVKSANPESTLGEVRIKVEPGIIWNGLDHPGEKVAAPTSAPANVDDEGDDEGSGADGDDGDIVESKVGLNGEKLSLGPIKKRRRRRINWSVEDELRLMMTVAIVRSMAEIYNTRYSWIAVARVFDGVRTAEHCRHRSAKLMGVTDNVSLVDSYKRQFGHQYSKIALQVPIDPNLIHFDPRPALQLFKPISDVTGEEAVEMTPLPMNTNIIEATYKVRHEDPGSSLYPEEKIYSLMSLPSYKAVMSAIPPTLRLCASQELDNTPEDLKNPEQKTNLITVRDEKLGLEHVIFSLLKAVYSTSHDSQTADLTRLHLSKYDPAALTETIRLSKQEWRLIVFAKSSNYRIPGQRLAKSERFHATMTGLVSSQWTSEASRLDELYGQHVQRMFQEDVSRAEMMVILTHVGQGWLKLSMVEESGQSRRRAVGFADDKPSEKPMGADGLLKFDIRMTNIKDATILAEHPVFASVIENSNDNRLKRTMDDEEVTEKDSLEIAARSNKMVKKSEGNIDVNSGNSNGDRSSMNKDKDSAAPKSSPSVDKWAEARQESAKVFEKLTQTIPEAERRNVFRAIFDNICGTEAVGVILLDLKAALIKQSLVATDRDIRECLSILEHSIPPIIVNIGLTHDRYVQFGHHEARTVNYQEALEFVATGDDSNERSIASKVPINHVSPRTWKRVDGTVDKVAYERALHAVATHISERPGVSKGTLVKDVYKVFMPVELDELFQELEKRKCLWAEYCILPPPASLFSKRKLVEVCDKYTIHERKITNLFVVPDYYRYLDMKLVRSKIQGPPRIQYRRADAGNSEVIEVGEDEQEGEEELNQDEDEEEDEEPEDEGEPEEDEDDAM
ncbi:RNA polymerase III transcription initiation factor complex subunit [Gryganskiella cystojenkinii]|nr:RNA polymerase III transcription initiation factor complex subunit [Gryganskiella cystojenkinii]